ncbi:MAG: hypothetical protein ACYC4Q_08255 [Victivallaceae bacterium]
MKTSCPYCNRKYDLSKTPLGGKVRCYGCNKSFTLPHSMSILKKEASSADDVSRPVATSISAPPPAVSPENHKSFGKIISESFIIGCLLIAFAMAAVAVICTFYNKVSFQIGLILALSACAIILIPILINLREINRKLKK